MQIIISEGDRPERSVTRASQQKIALHTSKAEQSSEFVKLFFCALLNLVLGATWGALNPSREWPLLCHAQDVLAGAANLHFPPFAQQQLPDQHVRPIAGVQPPIQRRATGSACPTSKAKGLGADAIAFFGG
jgi:hypothetical protein